MPDISAVEETRNPRNYEALPKALICQGCGESIIENGARYSCNTSGREWGHSEINVSSGYFSDDCDDSETQDSFDYEYSCDNCEHDINSTAVQAIIQDALHIIQQEVHQITMTEEQAREHSPFRDTPNRRRHPKLISQQGNAFDAESVAILRDAAIAGEFPMFNWLDQFYIDQGLVSENTDVPIPEVPTRENEEPESNATVIAGQHERWGRGLNQPSSAICDECQHMFLSDRDEEVIICPKCNHTLPEPDPANMRGIHFSLNAQF